MTRPDPSRPPAVTVIMAVYNGAAYLRQSISGLLAQTWTDFEIVVVDDCSTDETPAILAGIDDERLRVARNETNLGVVLSRNRGMARARGTYIALHDHDDLSRPTRLARQVAFLEANPGIALVATAAHVLSNGVIRPPRPPVVTSPALLAWMLLVANPLVCSSVMLRASAARRLDPFMRPDYTVAEDYDLYHRLRPFGGIARLDEPLTIYRQHETNLSRVQEGKMISAAERILASSYEPLFGPEAAATGAMVVKYMSGLHPVPNLDVMRTLQSRLRALTEHFIADPAISLADRALILKELRVRWARVLRAARRNRIPVGRDDAEVIPSAHAATGHSFPHVLEAAVSTVSFSGVARRWARRLLNVVLVRPPPPPGRFEDTSLQPIPLDPAQPPTLFVVVDTEAEFDWSRPMDRMDAGVGAIQHLDRGQAVFDRYGLRPVYVVDYPVTTNPDSVATLRAILDRGGCEIGAHLHPWTTPPFAEPLSDRNSYPGNLPRALEFEKMTNLIQAIERSFGVKPLFYKAGRYGFGPNTAAILAELGIRVDFSFLPGADLRRKHGPDFRGVQPSLYWLHNPSLVAAPMTRSTVGFLPPLGRTADWLDRTRLGRHVPLRSVLARLRLSDTITLTPEGVTTAEQIRLIRSLLRRGQRQFILHYHSPSLAAGNTSYAPDETAVAGLVQSLSDVCTYFFDEVGGVPGYPQDLLPPP